MFARLARWLYTMRRSFAAHSAILETLLWAFLAGVVAYQLPHVDVWLAPYLSSGFMERLQTVVVTVGGAMIGTTAIASSFVLFATQVNVERLPYGLFYRFSLDWRLLSAFGLAFVAAIGGTAISLISAPDLASVMIASEMAAVAIVLRLLLLAYRRSLHLVNPLQQLNMIARQADRDLQKVDRQIRWTSPSIAKSEEGSVDTARRAIFDTHPDWDGFLRDTIEHAVAFARRAGEQGDLEISAAALNGVVALNRRYVQVRGRTFFANNLLIDNPLVSDRTINVTLEALRRLREVALARRDEPQLEQIFRTFAALCKIYLQIEYGAGQSKSHALLAAGYLEAAIEAVLPHQLIDTAMQGVRLLGKIGQNFFVAGELEEGVNSTSKLAMFGMLGAVTEKHRPLTLTTMEQFRDLLFVLLRVEARDIGFPAREIRTSISQLSKLFLDVPDTPLSSTHSTYLAPIFSSTSYSSLRFLLTPLVNALADATDQHGAERIADHLAIWSDGLYQEQKELLLLAIEKRSHFAFDMIHWITGVTELLACASRSPHTRDHSREELERHALWLFSAFTWIPTDEDTVRFVENLSFRGEVFQIALKADRDGWLDGYETAWKLSLKWAIEGGRHHTGWGTLERWLTALCALALRGEVNRADQLITELTARLASANAPNQEMRDRAAQALRQKTREVREREFETELVERVLASNDRDQTLVLLRRIADILSPARIASPVIADEP